MELPSSNINSMAQMTASPSLSRLGSSDIFAEDGVLDALLFDGMFDAQFNQDTGDELSDMMSIYEDEGNSPRMLTGDEADSLSVMSELDLQSPAPPAALWVEDAPISQSNDTCRRNVNTRLYPAESPTREPFDGVVVGGGGGGSSLFARPALSDTTLDDTCEPSMTPSSTASVSEFSDDSSLLSSVSSRPAAHRRARADSLTASPSASSCANSVSNRGSMSSKPKPSSICPRLTAAPTAATLNCLAAATFGDLARLTAHAHKSVTSGNGAPIFPSTYMPSFHAGVANATVPVGASGGVGTSSASASSVMPALPSLGGLDAATVWNVASGAASQVLAAGWKRLRGGDEKACRGREYGQRLKSELENGPAGALRSVAAGEGGQGAGVGDTNAVTPAVRKRAKREERLMKNREAANRSRIKRKEILSELENRAGVLSRSLDESREENAHLKFDIASLREQNSFLRGMLSAVGRGNELPPILPQHTSSPSSKSVRRSMNGAGGRASGGNAAVTGVGEVIGVVGAALTIISCVGLSAAGYGNGAKWSGGGSGERGSSTRARGIGTGGGSGNAGGRRMILSTDDGPIDPSFWGTQMVDSGVAKQGLGDMFALASVLLVLFVLTRLAFDTAMQRRGKSRESGVRNGVRFTWRVAGRKALP